MATDQPAKPEPGPTDDELDRLVYEALRRDGPFVPQSPEEVAGAESEIDEAAVELPPGLRDPLALLGVQTAHPQGAAAPPVPPSYPQTTPPAEHRPAEPAPASTKNRENPMRGTRLRKMIAWLVVGAVGT